jgi:phosphate:Na+ symporter
LVASIVPFLVGIVLFYSGVRFVSANLIPLAGRRFRRLLTRTINHPWLGALTGILAGVIIQSANAVTVVTISMVSAGIIDKRRAMAIPIWGHVGACLLVMLVAIDARVEASYGVALAGFTIYLGFERTDRLRHMAATFLGIALLFLGIAMLKAGADPLRDAIIGQGLLAKAAHYAPLSLLLGAALAMVSHSSAVTGAIAVTTADIGLVDLTGASLIVLGANLGSGLNYALQARTLKHEGRQIALMQSLQKLFGFVALVTVFAAERGFGRPTLERGIEALAHNLPGQVALVFLLYQLLGSTICTVAMGPLVSRLERLLPPGKLDMFARPEFLSDEALVEPSLALELVVREERRLIERLPSMLDQVRADGDPTGHSSEALKTAGIAIAAAMSRYLEAIAETGLDRDEVERLTRLQHRTANLGLLYDSLDEFVAAACKARFWPASGRVADQMIEAMHALLGVLVDSAASEDAIDQQLILSMLGNRDELMERMRRRVLQDNPELPAEAQQALFAATMLFERAVWLARRGVLLILPAARENSHFSLAD